MRRFRLDVFVLAGLVTSNCVNAFTPFGNSWCGKPYEPNLAPQDPGGQTPNPTFSSTPLLDLSIQPRYNLYLESESSGSFIVDVPLSNYHGVAYHGLNSTTAVLNFTITVSGNRSVTLATGGASLDSTSNEVFFSLSSLSPRSTPYDITISLTAPGTTQVFTAHTHLSYLPDPSSGSVTKIDNLFEGLLVARASDLTAWTQLFPYGWYANSGITSNPDNANAYLDAGYNFIHFVPDDSNLTSPFAQPAFDTFLDRMEEIGLYLVYDMRGTYMNSSLVTSQVSQYLNRTCLLMWYTADEPDGWSYPLNSTQIAYNQIKALDPYHPVSLVLNCIDFYYEAYSLGADIILEDAYPIGINATWSTQYDTPCTWDQGDCGCDGCIGSVSDVPTRIDILRAYQEDYRQHKPIWAAPQGFGNDTYWPRYPTGVEEVVMQQLAINHHAMGISTWIYPSSDELGNATSAYATAITRGTAASFLLNSLPLQTIPVSVSNATSASSIDASAWQYNGSIMVGIVNEAYTAVNGTVILTLPASVTAITQTVWGSASGWHVHGTNQLSKYGLGPLEVDVLILT